MKRVFHQFANTTLDDYVPINDSQMKVKEKVALYTDKMDIRREKGRGLTLLGPAGVGKTMLASVILNKALEEGYRIEAMTVSGYIDLLLERSRLHDTIKSQESTEEAVDDLIATSHRIHEIQGWSGRKKATDWVLFDDLGREHESQSGWTQVRLHDILRDRYNRGLPSLVTSNLPAAEIARVYSDSLVSFLHEAAPIVEIQSTDHRSEPTWNEDS